MCFRSAQLAVRCALSWLTAWGGLSAPVLAQASEVEAPAETAPAHAIAPEPEALAEAEPPVEPESEPEPESQSVREARPIVARAKALFAVGDYRAALAELTRAYELLEGDPRQGAVLNNIAVCYERMFRYDLALQYYARYLEQAAPDAEDRAEVEAVMHSLQDLLGTVRVTGPVAGEVWVSDRMLGHVPVDVLVPAGMHVIEVRARGYQSERRELRVTARAVHGWHVALEPLPSYRGLSRAYFWTGAALTGAALITGSALGVAALDAHAEGEEQARAGLAPSGQRAQDLALGADIAFGSALVLGVGTAVLFFFTDWEAERKQPARARISTTPAPISIHAGGLPGAERFAITFQGVWP